MSSHNWCSPLEKLLRKRKVNYNLNDKNIWDKEQIGWWCSRYVSSFGKVWGSWLWFRMDGEKYLCMAVNWRGINQKERVDSEFRVFIMCRSIKDALQLSSSTHFWMTVLIDRQVISLNTKARRNFMWNIICRNFLQKPWHFPNFLQVIHTMMALWHESEFPVWLLAKLKLFDKWHTCHTMVHTNAVMFGRK